MFLACCTKKNLASLSGSGGGSSSNAKTPL
jgi:hypothetical protein